MSHRTRHSTDIKDLNLATQTLKDAGWEYKKEGSTLRITSGPMRYSTIDLRTGIVTGDSDFHNRRTVGAFRQRYSEQRVRQEAVKSGATIESREVLQNGDIRFVMTANFSASFG